MNPRPLALETLDAIIPGYKGVKQTIIDYVETDTEWLETICEGLRKLPQTYARREKKDLFITSPADMVKTGPLPPGSKVNIWNPVKNPVTVFDRQEQLIKRGNLWFRCPTFEMVVIDMKSVNGFPLSKPFVLRYFPGSRDDDEQRLVLNVPSDFRTPKDEAFRTVEPISKDWWPPMTEVYSIGLHRPEVGTMAMWVAFCSDGHIRFTPKLVSKIT